MKKWIALLLSAVLMLSLLAGCGGDDKPATTPDTPADSTTPSDPATTPDTPADDGKPEGVAEEQVVKLLYTSEISDWNPLHPSAAGTWANWIDTLVEYDNYGLCQPCLAESWTKSEDGLTWTFKIREGVKWQYYDGTQYGDEYVKAEDWVTSAKWILDPANTARTADLLFDMVGAEDYYLALEAGQEADWDTVGIKAISEYEIQYQLTEACPWFLSRLTYNWGYPTSAKFLEEMGESFGTDNTTILYCGAFLCTEWEPQSFTMNERNPEYWDIEDIHIERIEETYNAEAAVVGPEMLLRGDVTSAEIPSDQIDEWMNDPAKASEIRPVRAGTYNYWFLFNFMPTYEEREVNGLQLDHEQWLAAANNLNFRKALYYGLDRIKVISIYDPYNPEAFLTGAITKPDFCAAGGTDYIYSEPLKPYTTEEQFQPDEALKYRDAAKAELEAAGVTLPIVAYMPYNTGGSDGDMAVVVTQQLEDLLGKDFIRFVIEGYPSTDYLNNCRRSGNYSFQLCYWGPDYADPLTYTDPFRLGQAYAYLWRADGAATQVEEGTEGARKGRNGWDETWWINHDYTDMVEEAAKEVVDMEKRYNALAECEAWLLENAYVIPIGPIGGCGYIASYLNPFEAQFAPFGLSDARYKYQWVYEDAMDSETYMELLEEWQTERANRIAAAQAAGIDY